MRHTRPAASEQTDRPHPRQVPVAARPSWQTASCAVHRAGRPLPPAGHGPARHRYPADPHVQHRRAPGLGASRADSLISC